MRLQELIKNAQRIFVRRLRQQVRRVVPERRVESVRKQRGVREIFTNEKCGVQSVPNVAGVRIVNGDRSGRNFRWRPSIPYAEQCCREYGEENPWDRKLHIKISAEGHTDPARRRSSVPADFSYGVTLKTTPEPSAPP